jgi:hypothetical protein
MSEHERNSLRHPVVRRVARVGGNERRLQTMKPEMLAEFKQKTGLEPVEI